MDCLFLLSKEHQKIAESEFQAVMKTEYSLSGSSIITVCSEKEIETARKRLAYCNMIFELLFSCHKDELEDQIKKFDWNKVYEDSYVVRKINCSGIKDEKYYGSMIWHLLNKPKVELKNARTKIFITGSERIFVCRLICENDKSYLERGAAMKPSLHPTAIHPKLAKAMINLSGCEEGENIADPFCGTGGILIEASIMGIESVGYDISDKMLSFAKENLEKNGIKKYEIEKSDATKARIDADYVISDLPYGKNSAVTADLKELYSDFILHLKKSGIRRAVLGFPSFFDFKNIINNAGFELVGEFEIYLHKSLSKTIVVIQ